MSDVIRHVLIRGTVQGVGFRYWTRRTASARGLQGWVRNRGRDGVEAVFAGPEQAVAEMIALCRRGPASARVVAVEEIAAQPDALDLRRRDERFSELPTV
ncbi:acylphosphatase [Bradyrhizobium sp.]|jgi:acylphosphatase|uniref:acylphosphatase n=1 Tax=Bradyrhizobium sp. TaxID=376 RepID=UPI002E0486F2|nr:acylphosphatase [Bradyrhizobium sp.]